MLDNLNFSNKLLLVKYLGLIVTLHCSTSFAQVSEDVGGSADIPFIGRYPGSVISTEKHSEYDTITFPKALNTFEKSEVFPKLELAGERSVLIYDVPPDVETNVLKVFKSMEKGFIDAGFATHISCSGENGGCGSFMPRAVISDTAFEAYYRYRFKEFYNLNAGQVYLYSGSLLREGSEYYLFAVVARSKYSSFIQYSLDLLKVESLNVDELVLTTEHIGNEIQKKGKVVLEGLFFDHDSVVLKAVSEKSLETIANYLKAHPEKKYYVVGHTDTEGGFAYNQKLSQGRADAVLQALVGKYSTPQNALKAYGVAFVSPVASNQSENEREKNRRVELVEVNKF